MKYLVLCLALACLVGCCSGVDPKSVSYDASYRATVAPTSYGVTPPVKKALMIPPSILKCGTDWLNKIVTATGEGIMCVGENITPDVVIPVLTAPAPANASVCAPAPAAASPCASGACAPPAPKAAAGCR